MQLLKVGAAVLNQTPLAWESNKAHILAGIEAARRVRVSLLCLPELCITGYGCEDAFQSPDAVVSLICHYAQLGASSSWQVLGRVSDRCGSMHQISVVHSRIGQTIRVPQPTRPDEAIIARMTAIPLPLTTAPLSFLFKASSMNIVVNDNVVPNRFITATAAQPHLMIQPRDLGYSCAFSYQPINRFSITGGGDSSGTAGVVVSFYSIPVAPAPGGSSSSCGGAGS